jgi:TPR repeat protein
MSDPADLAAGDTTGDTSAPAPVMSDPVAHPDCPRCKAALGRLAAVARFCPRCGFGLAEISDSNPPPSAAEAAAEPPEEPATSSAPPQHPGARTAAWLQLRETHGAKGRRPAGAAASTPSPAGDSHSLMLLGYANAMYRLGWRYETGLGMGRNTEEAIRCYFKAAKLGNPAALARLAPQCLNDDKPAPPPEPPGGAS